MQPVRQPHGLAVLPGHRAEDRLGSIEQPRPGHKGGRLGQFDPVERLIGLPQGQPGLEVTLGNAAQLDRIAGCHRALRFTGAQRAPATVLSVRA